MEIKKTRLDNIGNVHPESKTIRDQEFCIGFNVINISKGECVNFGGDGISRYHIVLEGEVQGRYQDGRTVTIQTGETFGCEKEDLLEIKGDAKIFNMLLVGGIRGYIRTKLLTQPEKLTVGEGVGESFMAILSPNGNFTLEYNKEKIYCEMGHAIVVQTG